LKFKFSTKKFVDALEVLNRQGIADSRRKLLLAHYASPGRRSTMAQLARQVGYSNYGGANLQYGTLAKDIGQQMGVDIGYRIKLSVIATWTGPGRSGEDFNFVMRPELAAALEHLGWTGKKAKTKEPRDLFGMMSAQLYIFERSLKGAVNIRANKNAARVAKLLLKAAELADELER
jgi:hypothetical protein